MARKRKNEKQELFGIAVAGTVLILVYIPKEIAIAIITLAIIGLVFFIKSKLDKKKLESFKNDNKLEVEKHKMSPLKSTVNNTSGYNSLYKKEDSTPYHKGIKYEEKVAKYFRKLGYDVDERGKRLGKKDGGIDLIASNQKETFLIQCKNYKPTTKINHIKVKEFHSNCLTFLNKTFLPSKTITFKMIFPHEESLKKCAIHVFEDTSNNCTYQIIN